jgi:hypothetical protein
VGFDHDFDLGLITQVSTWSMGSLGLVGEILEVRAHVDHDLTIVCRVDRQLGLLKIWGVTTALGEVPYEVPE